MLAIYGRGGCRTQFTQETPANGSRQCPDYDCREGLEGELAEIDGAS
jgi:hypothetical protein